MNALKPAPFDVSILSRNYDKVLLGEIDLKDGEAKFNREIKRRQVNNIKKVFDPLIYGPPVLYRLDYPKDGKLYGIVDGQNRTTVLFELADEETELNMRTPLNATILLSNEAEVLVAYFKSINSNSTTATETDKAWGDEFIQTDDIIDVLHIIRAHQIRVGKRRSKFEPTIVGVGKLRDYYNERGREQFVKAFDVIEGSFFHGGKVQMKAIENYFILALLNFIKIYPEVENDTFKEILATTIEKNSESVKRGGHKNYRLTLELINQYADIMKERGVKIVKPAKTTVQTTKKVKKVKRELIHV